MAMQYCTLTDTWPLWPLLSRFSSSVSFWVQRAISDIAYALVSPGGTSSSQDVNGQVVGRHDTCKRPGTGRCRHRQLYAAFAWPKERQAVIETSLARRHLAKIISRESLTKAARKRNANGDQVCGFRELLDHLGTLTRNREGDDGGHKQLRYAHHSHPTPAPGVRAARHPGAMPAHVAGTIPRHRSFPLSDRISHPRERKFGLIWGGAENPEVLFFSGVFAVWIILSNAI